MNKDTQLLEDIYHHTELILDACSRIDFEEYIDNEFSQNGFIRSLEVIGEATKKISSEFRTAHPEIPWRGMAGLRDKLIHGYGYVDVHQVWDIITNMVPRLHTQMAVLLNK